MINAELSYNPYLMETNIRFNGQPPRINSLVEKYQNMDLQSWISRIPKIFYDEMNGYYFELDFNGTQLDFEALCNTFHKAGITDEIVPIVHKESLGDRITKQDEIEYILKWLENNSNRRFDYDAFRAENSDLFDSGYSYVYLHGRGLDGSMLEDMNVSVEYVEKVEDLNNTDLNCTPILIHITETTLPLFAAELNYFKARTDVTEEQLFFNIGGLLDQNTIERVIRDLGVINPKIVQTPADAPVRKYIEVYPITVYIRGALDKLREAAEIIGSDLEKDNEESIIKNREIHEKIDSIDESLERLNNAKDFYTGYSDSAPMTSIEEMEEELLGKINDWRSRRTVIYKLDEAAIAARDFQKDVTQWLQTFGKKAQEEAADKINGARRDFKVEYDRTEYDDFRPDIPIVDIPVMDRLDSFDTDLLTMKEEKYVEAKDMLIGIFFKGRQVEEKQMVLETTFYYKKWRDYVSQNVKTLVDSYLDQLKLIYKDYLNNLRTEYLNHIENSVEQEVLKRNEVASQLSEDEKLLETDNDWLAKFNEQRVSVERG